MSAAGKYTDNEVCDWCGECPARSYILEKRGVKLKRYAVAATACQPCALRLGLVDDGKP